MALDFVKLSVGDIIQVAGSPQYVEDWKLWRAEITRIEGKEIWRRCIVGKDGQSRSGNAKEWKMFSNDLKGFDFIFDFETAEELEKTSLRSASDYMKDMGYGA